VKKTRSKRATALRAISLATIGCCGAVLLMTPRMAPEAAQNAAAVQSQAARPSSAAIRSSNVDATASWYVRKLGFKRISEAATVQARRVVLERDSFLLEVVESAPDRSRPLGRDLDVETTGAIDAAGSGGAALSLLVDDVDAEVKRLRKQGVEVVAEPEDAPDERSRVALLRDDGGRTIELREPLAPSGDFHGEGR
jgi:catechol 2,3-dioxygenase-like lactoylglutathione lyase family enzyme